MSLKQQIACSRTHPFPARIKERRLLSKEGTTKEVYHLCLNIEGSGITYKPGDVVGILPQNPLPLVEHHLNTLKLRGDETITCPRTNQDLSARSFFLQAANLSRVTPQLTRLSPQNTPPQEPLDLLRKLASPPPVGTLPHLFAPLLPRFYSIASSQRLFPNEIHLTIVVPSFIVNGEKRFGVASSFLCRHATPKTPIPLYIQPSKHFTIPEDLSTPLIMIGPGMGVAPFRAFMQEREAQNATGKHWLFFGDRQRRTDFYYEEEWLRYVQENRLKLDLAFSRDQAHKIYVQDRLLEHAEEIWEWVEAGAVIYVCGDAKNMAKAVEAALLDIIKNQGKQEDAHAFLTSLRKQRRYLTDVY